jgi:riboflavin transporter FmnP
MPNQEQSNRTAKLVKMSLLVAVAVICSLIHFPILPAAPFLEFEVSDIPILVSGFAFGPLPGLVVAAVSILLHDILIGMSSGPYGMLMHFIAIGTFVLVAGFIYKKMHSLKGAVVALAVGSVALVVVMIGANILITPFFLKMPVEAVYAMLPTAIIPFNVLKAVIVSIVTFVLYKRVSPFLHR